MRLIPICIALLALVSVPGNGAIRQGSQPSPSPNDRLLLLDAARLAHVRSQAAANATLKAALAALEEDTRKALAIKPASVMDKGVTPPSGDKHDYMSQAPYWWPDPSKPGGRPYVRRDGDRNPEINKITDRDNLGRITNAIATLGLAFHLLNRDEYGAHAARLTRVWFLDPATRMNPHLNFGQGIPGINDGRGIGIIETRDLVPMLDGLLLIAHSTHWTKKDEAGLQAWMRAYLKWLLESTHGKEESQNGNNHETWYDVQVAGLALYTGQQEIARRTLEGARQRVARQIEPDGRQPRELERTRAWDYSEFNLRALLDLAHMGDRFGLDLWNYRTTDGRGIRQAIDFMVPFATGERAWKYEQLGGFRPAVLHTVLRRAAAAWKAPAYRDLAMNIGGNNPRLDLLVP
jgi:hypothetical protein